MKNQNFAIIGGQYAAFCYGFTQTLTGAKRLARKNLEYWDNWQGWNAPEIYKAEDVEKVTNFYGETYAPKDGALPVAFAWVENNGSKLTWEGTACTV